MSKKNTVEKAIRTALLEHASDIRHTYADLYAKYGHTDHWLEPGYYDRTLARSYARIIAPRVIELIEHAAAA